MRVEYTREAKQQLRDTLLYVQYEFGKVVANKVNRQIIKDINRLGLFPKIGIIYSDDYESFTIRRIVSKQNYVFYTLWDNKVTVLQILGTRMSSERIDALLRTELNKIINN